MVREEQEEIELQRDGRRKRRREKQNHETASSHYKLSLARRRNHRRPPRNASLLPPWRQPRLAFLLPRNSRLPVNGTPLIVSYLRRRRGASAAGTAKPRLVSMNIPLLAASAFIGVLTGLDDYLYAYGVARLPVSTSALIIATQLGFTAFFAFLLVRQKFTSYSVNAVVLLTIGAVVLALHASGDRPHGESVKAYVMGFVMTVIAAALYGFVLPLVELVYKKCKQPITYSLVMEIQFVLCFSATLFCGIGMIVNNDFKAIPIEAKKFKHGEVNYYTVLVASAILWQAFSWELLGLFSVPRLCYLAEKGVSLLLSLWGMVSYFYGEIKHDKKMKKRKSSDIEATEMPRTPELGIIER
ncbi:hypothetical protein ACSQ67_018151 [Phaseolus vulgaris]